MKYFFKIVLLLFTAGITAQAQDIPNPMSPPSLVNDFAKIFDSRQQGDLEQMLRNYNDTTSTQIYVVTVADLQGYDVSDYATRLGQKWGVGQKGKNNGIIILIKPRIGNERGRVYIATGYGVEPILTDARCGRIIDNYMMPYLQNGDYYNASKAAAEVIIQYLSGEFKADGDNSSPDALGFVVPIIILLIIILSIFRRGKNGPGSGSSGGRGGKGFYPPILGGGRSSGGWGSGGGFGGGGGGSFGGGGAGRSF